MILEWERGDIALPLFSLNICYGLCPKWYSFLCQIPIANLSITSLKEIQTGSPGALFGLHTSFQNIWISWQCWNIKDFYIKFRISSFSKKSTKIRRSCKLEPSFLPGRKNCILKVPQEKLHSLQNRCRLLLKKYLFGCAESVAALGIFSCNTWDLVPWPKIEPWPLHWELGVLATGPPGKSPYICFIYFLWILWFFFVCGFLLGCPEVNHCIFLHPSLPSRSQQCVGVQTPSYPTLGGSQSVILATLGVWSGKSRWFWFASS